MKDVARLCPYLPKLRRACTPLMRSNETMSLQSRSLVTEYTTGLSRLLSSLRRGDCGCVCANDSVVYGFCCRCVDIICGGSDGSPICVCVLYNSLPEHHLPSDRENQLYFHRSQHRRV